MTWVENDGGRAAAGFTVSTWDAGDCVTRAIAIAGELPYRDVYDSIAAISELLGGARSARDGVQPKVWRRWFSEQGWAWTPTMQIGSGTTVHLRAQELPAGRIVARCSGHLVAVIDGLIHDTADPTRDGTRAVYGYWTPPS